MNKFHGTGGEGDFLNKIGEHFMKGDILQTL